MRAFVTGATGFVGGRLAARLRERGDEVVALVRDPTRAERLRALGCGLVEGDLSSRQALASAMESCDAVFHVAGIYRNGVRRSQRDELLAANVTGTETVLDAAVPRVVYVSSIGDVVEGMLLAHDRGRAGESYVLGGELETLRGAVEKAFAAGGRRARIVPVPTWAVRLMTPLGPELGVADLVSASDGVTYWGRDDKARRELGYGPRNLADGLLEAFG